MKWLWYYCRQGSHEIQPADVILFEGILAFYFKPLRDLFDVRLFVDLDADTRLAMRGTITVLYKILLKSISVKNYK